MAKVTAQYSSIECVRDICEPWINLWGGDEWGESMTSLHSACHTSYGFTNEDCALFASKLVDNLIAAVDDAINYSGGFWGYGFDDESGPKAVEETRKEASEARDYWRKGGNITNQSSIDAANETIDSLPDWLFEDTDRPSLF